MKSRKEQEVGMFEFMLVYPTKYYEYKVHDYFPEFFESWYSIGSGGLK